MAAVTALANQKGGVAKTTTAQALAAALAEGGRRVLLVDLDPQACLTFAHGVDPDDLDHSLHDVVLGRVHAGDVLLRDVGGGVPGRPAAAAAPATPADPGSTADRETPADPGSTATGGAPAVARGVVDLLPSTIDLAGAEVHLLSRTGREYQIRTALRALRDDYDHVLVDCPPSLGILTINGLTAADEVLIPLQCETLSHRGVGQLLETIDDVRAYTNEHLRIRGVVATLYDRRTRLSQRIVDEVRSAYGLQVLPPPVPRSVKVAEAPESGRSILHHAPRSPVAAAYRELAGHLVSPS